MTAKSLRHLSHYIALLVILMAGLVAMMVSGGSTTVHTLILVLISLGYFIWGVIHQFLEKEFHLEIILEYFLFSLLGLAFVMGVLYYL
ncbi:hypothetical protein A3D09_02575 [Candidatus Collierbacteria bacterium RIFCSPHIGHO2_02_FULL_49_10]|uniref:Uncharacterized protein n=2 Tax=Candidatus Collieribacteriota TaxID=1752725 RepID=A0A1F5EVS1_9BACT|nr:MAG: hypothetical protein A3D09_02575 [Candidatus Collierbacteria bacterium RIFCSPHIGHO2_02_FULL_49_10]OGD71967.1 MAG: hypothetical protein A2703_00440 [Candidatus Collierbacteria bacterium RIFCSPHIGHO2_01_FULL_50_25]